MSTHWLEFIEEHINEEIKERGLDPIHAWREVFHMAADNLIELKGPGPGHEN